MREIVGLENRLKNMIALDKKEEPEKIIKVLKAEVVNLLKNYFEITSEDVEKKYEAWGWFVMQIDGNDVAQIRKALDAAKAEKNRPTLIIGKTIMGKGARKADNTSYENNCATHGAPLGGDAYINTIKNLGGDVDNPFQLFEETKEIYAKRRQE